MDSYLQLGLTLVVSGVGGYIGVKVAVVQLQEQMRTVKGEIRVLRNRTHRHSTWITLMGAKLGLSIDPGSINVDVEGD